MTAVRARRLQLLVLQFERHGINRREDRIRLCADHAGRHLTSSSQLRDHEVDGLLERLRRLPVGVLHGAVARLVAAENRRAREAAGNITARLPAEDADDPIAVAVGVLTAGGLLPPAEQLTLEAPRA